jgi:hypothetical protein
MENCTNANSVINLTPLLMDFTTTQSLNIQQRRVSKVSLKRNSQRVRKLKSKKRQQRDKDKTSLWIVVMNKIDLGYYLFLIFD